MLQLKEALLAFRVHVIGDRRSTQKNGVLQNFPKRDSQSFQFDPGQPACISPRPDSGPKQALIRVDIADAGEECLVEQRSLDGQLSSPKQRSKLLCFND